MEAYIESLPEELKTQIISYLDVEPPSSSWYTHAPRLSLGKSELRPLKNLSQVSKAWRRLTKSSLFRCIRMNIVASQESAAFPLRAPSTTSFRHVYSVRKAEFKARLFKSIGYPLEIEWIYRHAWLDAASERAAQWLTALDQTLSDLLSFLAKNKLASNVESVSILGEGELDNNSRDYITDEVHCLIASATFWDVLFRSLEPSQITLVAPPSTLACLLNCSIRMLDSWAFPGMNNQLVTLKRPRRDHTDADRRRTSYSRSEAVHLRMGPNDYARPALASLLYIRPWTHIFINEGSYLQAYSTYEYFHKEPPGIVYPLAQGFEVPMSLESITYHSVFPFHDYLAAAVNLMSTGIIRSLHVKLAPDADDKTWDDPCHVGKADITDCWGEIEQVYSLLFTGTTADATAEDGHLAAHSNVSTFSSGDCKIESIRDLLVRSFKALEWDGDERGMWAITEAAAARRRVLQGLDELED